MNRIGFVGTGHIAAPMARRLLRGGHRVWVSERNAGIAAGLAAQGATVAPNQQVVDAAEIVFLCLRPWAAREVVEGLTFRADHKVVSVMAEHGHAALAAMCAPATDISMTIPIGFLETGGCPLPAFPDDSVLGPLFGDANPVTPVASERALLAHFGVTAMLPGMLALIDEGAKWLADRTGDPAGAEVYATQLIGGFLAAMQPGAGRLDEETSALATPGTLSLMLVDALREGGAMAVLTQAMDDVARRVGA